MLKQFRLVLTVLAIFGLVLFVLFVINQTSQIVSLAETFGETAGKIVLYFLLAFYVLIVAIPFFIYIRRPVSLRPPADEQSRDYHTYILKMSRRLKKNPHLQDMIWKSDDAEQVRVAIAELDEKADQMIRQAAATVFVTTAISQSGRLDALFVLLTQTKMIWQISSLYNQRPSLSEMVRLYANVCAAAFLATELDDLDIGPQIEPVVTAAMGTSLVSIVPGFSLVGSVVMNSLLDGAANAFLTLRVGVITRKYCGLIVKTERKAIRRYATVMAAQMIGSIVMDSAKTVTAAIVEAFKRKVPWFGR